MKKFLPQIDDKSSVPKFQQIVDHVKTAINANELSTGDPLPSVNQLCQDYGLSRDTVFKAYAKLKEENLVYSVPNKGYFVSEDIYRVFLFLDTFKAYKEVLYMSLQSHLPKNYLLDVHFHHYKIELFEYMIRENMGKYSSYIIMSFDHKRVKEILALLPEDKLMVIDWAVQSGEDHSVIRQDFGKAVYGSLESGLDLIRKYRRMVFIYPDFTFHPRETIDHFKRFCKNHSIEYDVLYNVNEAKVEEGELYFLVSDRNLSRIIDRVREKNYSLGKEIGIISYNETPMKKYIDKGISVITTDFEEMGRLAARWAVKKEKIRYTVPTRLIIRESL